METPIKNLRTRIALDIFQTFLVDANMRDRLYEADFQKMADKAVEGADCLIKSLSLKDVKAKKSGK